MSKISKFPEINGPASKEFELLAKLMKELMKEEES